LRYEGQTGIADHANFAPRMGFAWAPGARGGRNPKTVIRAGAGIFYDIFTSALLMNATLLNEINQTQYLVRNPDLYPLIPDVATLSSLQNDGSHIGYRVDSSLHVPYMLQTAVGIERQLPHGLSLAVNYTSTRGGRQLLTRDINAPLPTAFNNLGEAIGPRPRQMWSNIGKPAKPMRYTGDGSIAPAAPYPKCRTRPKCGVQHPRSPRLARSASNQEASSGQEYRRGFIRWPRVLMLPVTKNSPPPEMLGHASTDDSKQKC
jgi:hypothetical protein